MEEFIFYVKLGVNHVLDLNAYDHILFLAALTIPFTFKDWRKVLLLTTVFTFFHCLSLYLSAYGIVAIDSELIEFLIPVTIFITALFNLITVKTSWHKKGFILHIVATAFFGLIHGFGFSNYYKMLTSEEEDKFTPLFGFAIGIEIAQVVIVLAALLLGYFLQSVLNIKSSTVIIISSILIILITIPMLINTFVWYRLLN